jgi:hypothetical protein
MCAVADGDVEAARLHFERRTDAIRVRAGL